MLLAVDVGNSETVIGLFEDGAPELVDHWRRYLEEPWAYLRHLGDD